MTEEEKPRIIVDYRESKSNVIKKLFELDCLIDVKKLEVGDFLCSERACIERKTTNDFLNSLIDKRLFSQAKDLREQFEKPLIIIEGEDNLFSLRKIHPNAIMGALSSLVIDYGIPIIKTNTPFETAQMIKTIAKREQFKNGSSVSLRGKKTRFSDKEQKQFIVEGLPFVGPKLAETLLKEFRTIKNIFNAKKEDLKKIKNLGEKKAEYIVKIISEDYEKKSY